MRVTYCIPTCLTNAEYTLKVLLPSMFECGIIANDIIVVEGGNNKRSFYENDFGVKYIKTNHNSFDHTAIIELVENNFDLEYVFNIHDTCKVGPKFKGVVDSADFSYEKIAVYHNTMNGSTMAMGLIKYTYLLHHRELINTFKNTDSSHEGLKRAKYRAVELEDTLFWKLQDVPCGAFTRGVDRKDFGEQSIYGGVKRLVEYYEPLDLYKYKSNWGQSSDFTYDL